MAGMADRKTKPRLKRISFVAHHLAAFSSVMLLQVSTTLGTPP
jgi:hypothetical protein